MPLSEAARAMLAGRAPTRASTAPAAAPEPKAPKEPSRTGFAERAKAEAERFLAATDTGFWLCLCFREPWQPAAFTRRLNLTPVDRRIPGPQLDQALAGARRTFSPAERVRQLLASRTLKGDDADALLNATPLPDPLAGLAVTGDLAADAAAELAALHTALTAPADPAPAYVLDSPHYLIAYWPDRAAKDTWLAAVGLDALGDRYLDGHQAAQLLHITLTLTKE